MTTEQIKTNTKEALQSFAKGNLTERSLNLFETLGYVTDRRAPLHKPTYEEFKDTFISEQKFDEIKAITDDWNYVDLLFQLSNEEIRKLTSLFDTKKVDNTIIEAYLFICIELRHENYSRTQLSMITREVNKLFSMPVMVLFKYGKFLTLSVINRRENKSDRSKDVLEKITLIKDINIESPHRAHIEILNDLAFDSLNSKNTITNFVELHNAWQKVLDTKELNKKFFQELSAWYFWAVKNFEFPSDTEKNREIRSATSVIRLITRLMFVWFLKEKGFVPQELFDKKKLLKILKNLDDSKSTFYKAILQNMFFATLNTEMGSRKFRSKSSNNRDGNYFIHNVFRYEDYFHSPNETLHSYFDNVPFLNGGLFECLDKEIEVNGKSKRIRIDGFSDRDDNPIYLPNEFFFCDNEKDIDLNDVYGTKNKKYKFRGIIDILNSYKFTITENTPIEEEIALDPELLGKVFENLLANYNPETQTTARKQTGSFYTPREIVNYMVDESLIAYLTQTFSEGENYTDSSSPLENEQGLEQKLRNLLSYSDEPIQFDSEEVDSLINAIDNIKILDPACGSGAFPMGILQKLVHILHKLDPKNKLWKQRQFDKASQIDDAKARDAAIDAIEEAFENNELDYGRKLYLIENCIYGVDIQPIAAQISKLRFFISLIVEQKANPKYENLGIRPLPNLETKFVAANTLIGLEKEKEQKSIFEYPVIDKIKEQLRKVRHSYFEARTPKTKEKYRNQDKELRENLANILKESKYYNNENAKKIANWNPYDQNFSADFFEPEWMFGIREGFDIVIGNPPYVEFKNLDKKIKETLVNFKTTKGKYDLYVPFIEHPHSFLTKLGILTYICPTRFLQRDYGKELRKFIIENYKIKQIIDFSDIQIFENATTYTGVFIFQKHAIPANYNFIIKQPKSVEPNINRMEVLQSSNSNEYIDVIDVNTDILSNESWIFNNSSFATLLTKIKKSSISLESICIGIFQGIASGKDEVFLVDESTINDYKIERKLLYRILKGKDIAPYKINWSGNYILYPYDKKGIVIPEQKLKVDYPNAYEYLKQNKSKLTGRSYFDNSNKLWFELWNQRNIERFAVEKIVTLDNASKNSFVYDFEGYLGSTTVYNIILSVRDIKYKFLLALLNSKLLTFYHQNNTIPQAGGFYRYQAIFIKDLPIKKSKNQELYELIIQFILCSKKQNFDSTFFERLIDAMVYELYFPDEIKAAGAEVLKHLTKLPELKDEQSDEVKLAIIDKVYKELSDPKHPISQAMFCMEAVEEVRIIEGKE